MKEEIPFPAHFIFNTEIFIQMYMSSERDKYLYDSYLNGLIDQSEFSTAQLIVRSLELGKSFEEIALLLENSILRSPDMAEVIDPSMAFVRSHLEQLKIKAF
ncbi:hypothetical protein A3B57_02895 [Microgenomates group bacterium RIFCSPLOWO2_01_FULL_47_10]|nr:MAG: hypothetical protein A3B57_02895 [Microgenomates group bacterium RIFCSPLOWO2_01_FULL_47_10]